MYSQLVLQVSSERFAMNSFNADNILYRYVFPEYRIIGNITQHDTQIAVKEIWIDSLHTVYLQKQKGDWILS